jgi:hypothetical protein
LLLHQTQPNPGFELPSDISKGITDFDSDFKESTYQDIPDRGWEFAKFKDNDLMAFSVSLHPFWVL